VGRRLWSGTHVYPDLTVELVLYLATLSAGTPTPLGAHQLRYATFAEMQALPFCEADIPLLEELVAGRIAL
jgi:8-oxo-dGTP diphosphatase